VAGGDRYREATDCIVYVPTNKRWEHDDEDRPHVRFTTVDKLKEKGVLAEEIWEEA
jgi:hypothetical protein